MFGIGKTESEKTSITALDDVPAYRAAVEKLLNLQDREIAIERELADAKSAVPESADNVDLMTQDFLAGREPQLAVSTAAPSRPLNIILGERNAICRAVEVQ